MREKKLLINSVLYFFGSLGKGVASIVVVFMASFYISPSDMGVYDLIISTITLLQPVIIFQINDGIYRWILEKPDEKDDIIKCGFKIAYRNILIVDIIIIGISLLVDFSLQYKLLIAILLNLNCLYPLFQQITRGLKNHKVFAVSGIINGTLVMGLSYILMRFFNQGVKGFYIAQIIANIGGIAYLSYSQRISFSAWNGNSNRIKEFSSAMQRYSIMLVPNSVNQWVMKTLDKYCILFFMTTFENGIYTVAHRFPDILIMLNNMFYSAWVEQSIVEYKSEDRDEYFSKIYGIYSNVIISVVLVAIPITKYFIKYFTGVEYYEAYQYVPFLYIAVIFLGLSSFIGTGYLGTKHTEGIMWTSIMGSLVNTIINVVFMKTFGLQVAGVSSLCAYLTMWCIRVKQTKKFFSIKIKWTIFVPLIILAIIYAIGVQLNKMWLDFVFELLAIILAIYLNREIIESVYKAILKKCAKIKY